MSDHTQKCFANHLGLWSIQTPFLLQAIDLIRSGAWTQLRPATEAASDADRRGRDLYSIQGDGVAVIPISGPMTKGFSKYSHANTLVVRRAVRAAVGDGDVRALLLHADSPGGMVAGTQQLAADVRAARGAKPVYGFADDLSASACYWVLSQCQAIWANPTAEIGSIGTVAVVYDQSQQFKAEGIKVHVVSTGAQKGAFAQGAEVEPHHLAHLRERVEDLNGHFLQAVRTGRGLDDKQLKAVSDGSVFGAQTTDGKPSAMDLGLIDGVSATMDPFIDQISADLEQRDGERRSGAARALMAETLLDE